MLLSDGVEEDGTRGSPGSFFFVGKLVITYLYRKIIASHINTAY